MVPAPLLQPLLHPLPIYMRPNGFRAFQIAPAGSIPTPVLECLAKYPWDECRMSGITYRTHLPTPHCP